MQHANTIVTDSGLAPDPGAVLRAGLVREAAAGIVHDLGNLIQIASSALSMMSRNPSVRQDESLQPLLGRARTSLERAGALVHQTMGRTEAPETAVRPTTEPVDVAAGLGEIADLIAALCEPAIIFTLDVEHDLPGVSCSRLDLQNAVLNLAINARDAMPDGGRLTIVAGRGELPDAIDIKVMDDGAGMDPGTLLAAFTPRFTTKTAGRGNGLGLAMVKRFVEASGGQVGLASTPGVGTTVSLRLPTTTGHVMAQTRVC